MVLSVFVGIPMLALGPAQPGKGTIGQRVNLVRRFGKLSLQHHVLNLSIGSVSYIIPLAATLLISPQEVAYFSAAYLFTATMLIMPYLLAVSLFAERSGDAGLLHRHVRRTFPLGLALAGAIVLVVEDRSSLRVADLRSSLLSERNHSIAAPGSGRPSVRRKGPLRLDLSGPAPHDACIQGNGDRDHGRSSRRRSGRGGVGPHRDLRRLGCLGVVRSSRTVTQRAPGLSPNPSTAHHEGNEHGLAGACVRRATGGPRPISVELLDSPDHRRCSEKPRPPVPRPGPWPRPVGGR